MDLYLYYIYVVYAQNFTFQKVYAPTLLVSGFRGLI